MVRLYTFGLPAINWGNEFIPVCPLIRHDTFPISIYGSEVKIKSMYYLHFDDSGVDIENYDELIEKFFLISMSNNSVDEIKDAIRLLRSRIGIRDFYLTYKRPIGNDWVRYDIPILEDRYALKIVSLRAFWGLYCLLRKQPAPTDSNGKPDTLHPDVVRFIIEYRFITPGILKIWNAHEELRSYLPYRFYIKQEKINIEEEKVKEEEETEFSSFLRKLLGLK